MLTLWRCDFFYKIKYDLRGHSRSQEMTFLIKISPFVCLCYWLIEETNGAEHYERTKFDLYKDNTCLVLTLTYILMDNFLSLFLQLIQFSRKIIHTLIYSILQNSYEDKLVLFLNNPERAISIQNLHEYLWTLHLAPKQFDFI